MPKSPPNRALIRAVPPCTASFDVLATVEAVQLTAGRCEAMLTAARRELERAPWSDADPDAPVGAVSRVAILGHLLDEAEASAREVRGALGAMAARLTRHA